MKASLNWLTDYVDISMPAAELASLIMRIGFGVEEIAATDSDVVLNLEITSNRPDLLGHIGLAREIAAASGAKFKPPHIPSLPTSGKASELTSVKVKAPDLCPRYTARVIRGVKIGPSPKWLVERLVAVGIRTVNNVVDVTNYVMMEYSQPLHSFDLDKLAEKRIVVRRARNGENLVSIDGTKCELNDRMLVIADANKPVAIAGIMGGLNTEVTEKTTNLLIESAQFDQLCTRMTSRKLALMSESNYRFERGIDPVGLDEASLRACRLIVEITGGKLAEGVVDVWAKPFVPPVVQMRPQRCNAVLGMNIPVERQMDYLNRLGLKPTPKDGRIVCTIPSYRRDLSREIDLIEEIGRLEGYDKIPLGQKVTHAVTPEQLPQRTRKKAAAILTGAGFDETVTFTFVDAPEAALFHEEPAISVQSITRKTNNVLRTTVLPSLLRACKGNQDLGIGDVSLFEISAVFPPSKGKPLPSEHVELAMVTTQDLRELRGAVETLIEQIIPHAAVELRQTPLTGMTPDVSAQVVVDGEAIGSLGQIAPQVREFYGLEKDIVAAAINFDAILARAGQVRRYDPLPRFPAIKRDLSLIVDDGLIWTQIVAAVNAVPQPLRADVEYVTTYRGKPITDGKKSVTITLIYRSPDCTLRSDQIDTLVAELVESLRKELGAELRT